ncbi:hypothetical protein KUTeg_005806 [Tegillarca granosa]|uniref:protein-tyrosine-phosphatase n=1 Tax=Tegillarca granosa TaxID=220873 RepID=A0ABQ9ER79_TEGGR|nr:hypothetical protein KUTeg_014716 [Tegillarca granosa]KAJ8316640.1 hypothetical protein KUTeg_005806 [Tegillarca granosa]
MMGTAYVSVAGNLLTRRGYNLPYNMIILSESVFPSWDQTKESKGEYLRIFLAFNSYTFINVSLRLDTCFNCEPVEILPYLYLGNFQHASQLELLQRLGITALMNVSTNCKNHFEEHLQYMNIEVNDTDSADLSSWFPQAISFIDSVKERNGKVLVHCQAGVSRSATICLAYLMFTVKIGLEAAFEHVKSRRSSSNPSLSNTSSSTDTGSSGAFDYSGHEAMSTELSSCSASQTFSQGSSFSGSFDFPSASSYSSPQASLLSPKKDGWILETHGAILPNRYFMVSAILVLGQRDNMWSFCFKIISNIFRFEPQPKLKDFFAYYLEIKVDQRLFEMSMYTIFNFAVL